MATLYVTEYIDIDGTRQVPTEPPLVQQTVAIGVGSAASNPFDPRTTVIRVHCDAICSVLVGGSSIAGTVTNPTATAASGRMAANQTEYRGVHGGQSIAVITNT
jgi:hypothetical protein